MKGLKWFFSEFFVVVAGVVVAFVLSSWWQDIKQAQKEREYLRQIYREIGSTIFKIEQNMEFVAGNLEGCANLVSYIYAKELPHDSIIIHNLQRSINIMTTGQVSGTLRSLMSSGDIQLIRNDSLRTDLVVLEDDLMHFDQLSKRMAYDKLWPIIHDVMVQIRFYDIVLHYSSTGDLKEMVADSLSPFDDLNNIAFPPKPDFRSLFSKPKYKASATKLYNVSSSMYGLEIGFLERLKMVRTQLGREIQKWDKTFLQEAVTDTIQADTLSRDSLKEEVAEPDSNKEAV